VGFTGHSFGDGAVKVGGIGHNPQDIHIIDENVLYCVEKRIILRSHDSIPVFSS